MLTGQHPWAGMNQMAEMFKIGQKNAPPCVALLSRVGGVLGQVFGTRVQGPAARKRTAD